MDKPKLMSLKDAIKSAFKNLFDNASLGFLFKSYMALALVGAGVTLAIMIPGVIIFGISGKKPDVPTFSVLPSVSLGEYIVPESSPENLIPISGAQKVIGIDEVSNQSKTAITIYGILAVTIGFVVTAISITYAALVPIKMHQKNLVPVKELLLEAIRKTPKFLFLSIPMGLLIGFGYILLIIPGVIFTLMFLFAPYILLTEDVGVIEALKKSKELTKGHRWNLYKKGIGYTLLIFVGLIPLMFLMYSTQGSIVYLFMAFTPLVILKVFDDLKSKKQEMGSEKTPEEPENNEGDENVSEEIPTEETPEISGGKEEHVSEPKDMEPETYSDVQPTEIKLEDVGKAEIPTVIANSMEINEPKQPQPTSNEGTETPDENIQENMVIAEEPVIYIPDAMTMGSNETKEPEKPEIAEEGEREKVSAAPISEEKPPVNNFATPEESQAQAEKPANEIEGNG